MPRHALLRGSLWVALVAGSAAHAQSDPSCGKLNMGYGPFDYRKTTKTDHELVEKYHFTPKVEALIEGATTMKRDLGGDIAYLLHAFPNHPRGLLAMWRLSDQRKMDQPPGVTFTVDCYFERALRLAKDDTVVRVLYSQFLFKRNRKADSLAQLEQAKHYAGENPFSHYNIGLVYFEMEEYEKSLEQAHKALKLGMERPDLPNMLKRVNKWQEPAP